MMRRTIPIGAALLVVLAIAPSGQVRQGLPGGVDPAAARGADANLLTRLPTPAQWEANPTTKTYLAKATEMAGTDADLKFDYGIFCKPSGGSLTTDRGALGVPEGAPYAPFPAPNPEVVMPPQHLFDNFWWFGNTGIGAWLLTTSDGYILFDAMGSEADARDIIVGGMKKVGLDPEKIKYLIFGHSHLDHTGGGEYIQQTYHPRVIMGRDDWTGYFKAMKDSSTATAGLGARVKGQGTMTHDTDAVDGMKIKVGDVTATIYQMVGHTPGSIGMIVPVRYQGAQHPILIVTAATDVHNRESFVGGYEHIWDIGISNKVESVMQAHPNTNMNMLARTKYVTDHYPVKVNPLLYGADKTRRYIEIMRACTQARMDALGW